MKPWLQLISIGCIGGLIATSCVITSDDDGDDENGDAGETSTGGRSPTGGRPGTGGTTPTGGRANAGSPGTGGTSTTGGVTSTGGTTGDAGAGGTAPLNCSMDSTPANSCEFEDPDECDTCLAQECCDEVAACYGENPTDVCSQGEFSCVWECLERINDTIGLPTDEDLETCLGLDDCTLCDMNEVGSPNTGNLAACMNTSCYDECYGPPADEP